MGKDKIIPTVVRNQTIRCGEIDPDLPFLFRDLLLNTHQTLSSAHHLSSRKLCRVLLCYYRRPYCQFRTVSGGSVPISLFSVQPLCSLRLCGESFIMVRVI